jgi:SAM-dependent methyltransferase
MSIESENIFEHPEAWCGAYKDIGYGRTYTPKDIYWATYFHLTAAYTAFILRNLDNPLLVDIGGGPGYQAEKFVRWGLDNTLNIEPAKYCAEVYVKEIGTKDSTRRIALGNSSCLPLIRGRLPSLPIKTASVDAVFCADVLEHLQSIDGAVSEISRILKPGNPAVIAMPTVTEEVKTSVTGRESEQKAHKFLTTRDELLDIFRNSDLILDEDLLTFALRKIGSTYPFKKIYFATARDGVFILRKEA